jgi:two-component system chemotaxis response regulator CheB
MIKLLIVDDSALMRRQLATLFEAEGDFVVRQAKNGNEAVAQNREFEPDVVSLDINMPEVDGLTALSLMMAERPVPVVMVSSLTEAGALATFEALNLGAVDFIAKPGGTISLSIGAIKRDLVQKIRAAAGARIKGRGARGLTARLRAERERERAATRPLATPRGAPGDGILVIGVSTGGPRTLESILPFLPEDFPWPVLVAQHMPSAFTRPFAERLDGLCPLSVVEASAPMPLERGTIFIGKGGADMVLAHRAGKLSVIARPENDDFLWHPSVELLGRSALEFFAPSRVVGVILTGMGYDGADSFTEIKRRGGRTIAESEESSVVFGMPAVLIERGGASIVLHAERIAAQICAWAGR